MSNKNHLCTQDRRSFGNSWRKGLRYLALGSLFLIALYGRVGAAADGEFDGSDTSFEYSKDDVDKVMQLTPNLENGKKVYVICAVCHEPEGWGREDGYYPQIAGQLRVVQIKQLIDIGMGNRDNPTMFPFALREVLPTAQDIIDVSAYIEGLPMSPTNGVGPGTELALGEKIYRENCVDCHGENGEGVEEKHGPLIQGQHYEYLVRQFEWIRDGKRRNGDPEMVKQIKGFSDHDIRAQMDYVSRMRPPAGKTAPLGWKNPDFPKYWRDASAQ